MGFPAHWNKRFVSTSGRWSTGEEPARVVSHATLCIGALCGASKKKISRLRKAAAHMTTSHADTTDQTRHRSVDFLASGTTGHGCPQYSSVILKFCWLYLGYFSPVRKVSPPPAIQIAGCAHAANVGYALREDVCKQQHAQSNATSLQPHQKSKISIRFSKTPSRFWRLRGCWPERG